MSAAASSGSRGIKLGAEPRKLVLLGALIAVAVVILIYNSSGTSSGPSTTTGAIRSANAPAALRVAPHPREQRRNAQRARDRKNLRMQEVTVEAQQGSIDPTLRLDLLQRLKNTRFAGAGRSLFEPGPAELPAQLAKKVTVMPGPQPAQAPAAAPGPAGPAQPPPITLKFYGFAAPATANGVRRGFFLDEDDVVIANEGDTIKGRYHILSLQQKAAEVEDLTTKNRQSLPITPEGGGGAM
jgi:hypothetical protein